MTREHVWSDGLLELWKDEAPLTFDHSRGHVYAGDQVVRDLCGPCNNGLSPADSAALRFARQHLTQPIPEGTALEWEPDLLAWWVLKTASNQERSGGGHGWWRTCLEALTKGRCPGRADILFGPWLDLTPPGPNIAGIEVLAGSTASFAGVDDPPVHAYDDHVTRSWVLKVGFGAFLMIYWATEETSSARTLLVETLRSYGWLLLPEDRTTRGAPFNPVTCVVLGVIEDPSKHRDRFPPRP